MKKKFEYKGVKFDFEQLGEESYSVRCLTPNIDEQGIDFTQHPSDKFVSEKIGIPVEFLDGGDDSEYPESIYVRLKN